MNTQRLWGLLINYALTLLGLMVLAGAAYGVYWVGVSLGPVRLLALLVQHAITLTVLFMVFVGALWGSVASEKTKAMGVPERVMTYLVGFLLMAFLMLKLVLRFAIDWPVLCIIGLVMGAGGTSAAIWIMELWRETKFFKFLARVNRYVSAIRQVAKENSETINDDDTTAK